jgi:hypothetical protein
VLTIESARNQTILSGPELTRKPLWLRSEWGVEAISGSPMTPNNQVRVRYLRLVFPEDVKGSDIGIFEWAAF